MSFDIAEKIIEKWKTHPIETIIVLILAIALAAVIAYVVAFSTEKGTQHATPPTPAQTDQSETAAIPDKQASGEETSGTVSVEQKTTGDQSPAVATEGGDVDVTIIYEGGKESQ